MDIDASIRKLSDDVYALGKMHGRIAALNEVLALLTHDGQHGKPVYNDVKAILLRELADYPKYESNPPVKEQIA
jgi:hypothetical protein